MLQGSSTYNHDIALIRSTPDREQQFSRICQPRVIWPACWPRKGNNSTLNDSKSCHPYLLSFSTYLPGESYSSWSAMLIAGWGTTIPNMISLPGVLQKGEVFPVSLNTCKEVMGKNRIQPGMICAADNGTDTCQVGISASVIFTIRYIFAGRQWRASGWES